MKNYRIVNIVISKYSSRHNIEVIEYYHQCGMNCSFDSGTYDNRDNFTNCVFNRIIEKKTEW